jgi:hypothetical protein
MKRISVAALRLDEKADQVKLKSFENPATDTQVTRRPWIIAGSCKVKAPGTPPANERFHETITITNLLHFPGYFGTLIPFPAKWLKPRYVSALGAPSDAAHTRIIRGNFIQKYQF